MTRKARKIGRKPKKISARKRRERLSERLAQQRAVEEVSRVALASSSVRRIQMGAPAPWLQELMADPDGWARRKAEEMLAHVVVPKTAADTTLRLAATAIAYNEPRVFVGGLAPVMSE